MTVHHPRSDGAHTAGAPAESVAPEAVAVAAAVARPIPWLQVAGYQPHALHGPGVLWGERNCYVDVLVELLHAEAQAQAICMDTKDFERAYRAFVAKQKPVFEGN